MQWFDAGVNLLDRRFDAAAVIERAHAAQVTRLCVITTEPDEWAAAAELYAQYPETVCYTVGVHPHNARLVSEQDLSDLEAAATQPGVVAIGECGLDFNRDFSPRPVQQAVFEAQLAIAARLQLPVYLHERDAFEQQQACLSATPLHGGVAHCFTGTAEQLNAYLALGLHIGITGWVCDDKRGAELQQAVPHIPADRLVLETDAPYLFPKTVRPRQRNNEPALLPAVAEQVATLTGRPLAELSQQTVTNTQRLFGL